MQTINQKFHGILWINQVFCPPRYEYPRKSETTTEQINRWKFGKISKVKIYRNVSIKIIFFRFDEYLSKSFINEKNTNSRLYRQVAETFQIFENFQSKIHDLSNLKHDLLDIEKQKYEIPHESVILKLNN